MDPHDEPEEEQVIDPLVQDNKTFRVAFIHPDLGIGGAERLVVDAALGLQELGHDVEIITSHHDPTHCFEPTRDGTLKVRVARTSLPRHLLGAFSLPMAIFRQLSLFVQVLVAVFAFRFHGTIPHFLYGYLTSLPPLQEYDVFVVDQLSTIVPLLRIWTATRVIFYCHFPDSEVSNSIARQKAIERGQSGPGVLRTLYRLPFDMLEEMTLGTADKLFVNSNFTGQQFQKSFFRLARIPRVVYPGIDPDEASDEQVQAQMKTLVDKEKSNPNADADVVAVRQTIRDLILNNERPTLISINRFEAKKNVALAVDTFVSVQKQLAVEGRTGEGQELARLRLVIAGGYDHRIQDNIMTLKELQAQCTKHGLSHVTLFYNGAGPGKTTATPSSSAIQAANVIFLPSIPYPLLQSLLKHPSTRTLLYTPTDEHFGIVPLEAMVAGVPVLATNTGGPTESVVDLAVQKDEQGSTASPDGGLSFSNANGTGLLRRPTAKVWTPAVLDLLRLNAEQRRQLAQHASQRVRTRFSRTSMAQEFQRCLVELQTKGPVRPDEGLIQWTVAIAMFIMMAITFIVLVRWVNVAEKQGLNRVRTGQAKLRALQASLDRQRKDLHESLASVKAAATATVQANRKA